MQGFCAVEKLCVHGTAEASLGQPWPPEEFLGRLEARQGVLWRTGEYFRPHDPPVASFSASSGNFEHTRRKGPTDQCVAPTKEFNLK